ncbi:uncharacterized protein LOC131331079 [Rhododendron vialii]|uniref:uncharacterized protein LOC131331079 n=1 Tax=Rhododendron vialii TaxID=182163 RepID=UPI00265E4291|nr:uncharacterized protein LOC131331079 [Rhododendron vialii]
MEGDVVEMGQTVEILNESFSIGLNRPSVIVLKDESEGKIKDRAASVIFERPSLTMNKHIKPLYITSCLDGMPINRFLVDNGLTTNLIPRFMMQKLGKTDQDLVSCTSTLTDLTGKETTCHGILIMNLTVGSKTLTTHFFVVNSHSSFNVLLGRDWIHSYLAVLSTLH